MVGEEHIPPEEQNRRDAIAARRFHEEEMARWEVDRQFEEDMPEFDADLRPGFNEQGEHRGHNVFPRDMPPIEPRAQPVFNQAHRQDGRDVFQGDGSRAVHHLGWPQRRHGRNAAELLLGRVPRDNVAQGDVRPPWMQQPLERHEGTRQRHPEFAGWREIEGEDMAQEMARMQREAPQLWAQEQAILAERWARIRRENPDRFAREDQDVAEQRSRFGERNA